MVAASTQRWSFTPRQARSADGLRALARYDIADFRAGVRLREAVKRFLAAAVKRYRVEIRKSEPPKPERWLRCSARPIIPQMKIIDRFKAVAL